MIFSIKEKMIHKMKNLMNVRKVGRSFHRTYNFLNITNVTWVKKLYKECVKALWKVNILLTIPEVVLVRNFSNVSTMSNMEGHFMDVKDQTGKVLLYLKIYSSPNNSSQWGNNVSECYGFKVIGDSFQLS